MAQDGIGMSGRNFDAFVSSQRTFNEYDLAAKIQETYWRARQKFLAKIEKKEDACIVLSDSKLDSKLELYRSIDKSCAKLVNILENYQNSLFSYANEENSLGILLKECGKRDKTIAGKIMSITGKSFSQSSHQRIKLYMPLLRLYQEIETFHSRAVEDTNETVEKLESKRAQYRASLLWMKDISERLDPDVYQQLDKFRRVQNQVRIDKKGFDNLQMDVVQKIDLLMASRCNLINQILGSYQQTLLETFEKNYNNFRSIEELIKKEDIYEYEFKTLTQLNPLQVSTSESEDLGDLMQDLESDNKLDDNNNKNDKSVKEETLIDLMANSETKDVKNKQQIITNDTKSNKNKINQEQLVDLLKADEDDDNILALEEEAKQETNELNLLDIKLEDDQDRNELKKRVVNKNSALIDLLKNDLEDIDNNSYFKTLERLDL